jgi:hypothetical protein
MVNRYVMAAGENASQIVAREAVCMENTLRFLISPERVI